MNYYKVQSEMLKAVLNEKFLDDFIVGRGEYFFMIGNKFAVCIVPEARMMLDYDKLIARGAKEIGNISILIKSHTAPNAKRTNEIRACGKKNLARIQSDACEAWLDIKLLTAFDSDAEYEVQGPTRMVYVYEDGELAGIVAPTRVEK